MGVIAKLMQVVAGKTRAVHGFVRAKFDAAQTTAKNRAHWSQADNLAAQAAVNPAVRKLLRSRARYEIANNPYAKGMAHVLANDLIGTGPRLQLRLAPAFAGLISREEIQAVEFSFRQWMDAAGIADKLRLMRICRVQDGEAFLQLLTNEAIDHDVKIDVRLIEADQIATPGIFVETDRQIDGIEYDEQGNASAYHMLKQHPGAATLTGLSNEYRTVPAKFIIHYFRAERPGQLRGIPDLTPSLSLFADMRRFTKATVRAAEVAASHSGVLYTENPPDATEDVYAGDQFDFDSSSFTSLPAGWRLEQMKAEQPVSTYGDFTRTIIREQGRSLMLPLNVASGDSSGYNYSSGRLDFIPYRKMLEVDRHHIQNTVLRRLFAAWLDEAALISGLLPQSFRVRGVMRRFEIGWIWDAMAQVDPVKEATATRMLLEDGLITVAEAVAESGRDPETHARALKAEIDSQTDAGMVHPAVRNAKTQPAMVPADQAQGETAQ